MADKRWKDVPKSAYRVSDCGDVESLARECPRLLKPVPEGGGYLRVGVRVKGERMKKRKVHLLVAEAFLGPKPTPRHEINHKNGIKTDNRAVNLEWVTRAQNVQHCYSVLKRKVLRGEAQGRAKLTESQVIEIRARRDAGEILRTIADAYGVGKSIVSYIARREMWTHLEN